MARKNKMTSPQPVEPASELPQVHEFGTLLRKHTHTLIIVGGLILIGILVVVFYLNQQRRNTVLAWQALGVAETERQLEEILLQYPSSSATPLAILSLASQSYDNQSYEQAITYYQRFLQQFPRHPMKDIATLGLAMSHEAEGEVEQALEMLEAFIADQPEFHYLRPQALMGKARCLQQMGRISEARSVYEDFIVANPESEWKAQMEMELGFLERASRAQKHSAAVLSMPASTMLPDIVPPSPGPEAMAAEQSTPPIVVETAPLTVPAVP